MSLGNVLLMFLNFRQFEPQRSYKDCSYKKMRVVVAAGYTSNFFTKIVFQEGQVWKINIVGNFHHRLGTP